MFAIPAIVLLLATVLLRPHEIIEPLRTFPVVNLLLLAVILGYALDVRLGLTRLRAGPLLPWGVGYFLWSLFGVAVKAGGHFAKELSTLATAMVIFLGVSQGAQSFKAVRTLAGSLVTVSLFLAAVGVLQGVGPRRCMQELEGVGNYVPDERPCDTPLDCREGYEHLEWQCEHVGPFETTSIQGRVRYRGILSDPNELAMVVSIALPLVFARQALRPGPGNVALTVASLVLIGVCTVLTRSRSGQLVFLVVNGIFLLRRLRWAGVAVATLMAAPVLLLGGRSDAAADASTMDRFVAWAAGFRMFLSSPVLGVGSGQFVEHHYLTAHNSFVLVLAELGVPGVFLWVGTIYFTARWTWAIARSTARPEARVGVVWAVAALASLAGMLAAALFLSLANHAVLWTYVGLAGAIVGAVQRHDPGIKVPVRIVDGLIIAGIAAAFGAALRLYVGMKVGGG